MPANSLGQPIGQPVLDWQPVSPPPRTAIEGTFCRIEPLDVDLHARDLFTAFRMDGDNRNWTYLPYGPFGTEADFHKDGHILPRKRPALSCDCRQRHSQSGRGGELSPD